MIKGLDKKVKTLKNVKERVRKGKRTVLEGFYSAKRVGSSFAYGPLFKKVRADLNNAFERYLKKSKSRLNKAKPFRDTCPSCKSPNVRFYKTFNYWKCHKKNCDLRNSHFHDPINIRVPKNPLYNEMKRKFAGIHGVPYLGWLNAYEPFMNRSKGLFYECVDRHIAMLKTGQVDICAWCFDKRQKTNEKGHCGHSLGVEE